MPAVVVGNAGDARVADFRLARQLGFRQHRHAEDVRPPGFIEAALGAGGKGGAFHGDKRAALVDGGAGFFSRFVDDIAQDRAEGVGELYVGDDAPAEKGADCAAGCGRLSGRARAGAPALAPL